ncbi:hypothetical protein PGT21_015514 [Puccinia graminis f. sp. tritici]|uniref:Uncharacterized protein n=1 Tax=Puccinia graminis f. sp. tritici TaxID=56615 RepID=A0A5B0QI88_PUCGR|nr:hypothetical protein PGT21_015514 [Puccinia graminis f. sp. tritici]
MTRTSPDNLFTERRRSYRPRPTPLADQLRDLETLQRIQTGTDPRLLINPDIVLAHQQLEEDLHRQTDPNPADEENQPDEDFNHYNPASEANEDVDGHFSLIDELNAHHTSVDQQNRHQSINNHWTRLIPTLHGAYLWLQIKTNNWTSSNAFENFSTDFCTCNQFKHRKVDFIDLNSKPLGGMNKQVHN